MLAQLVVQRLANAPCGLAFLGHQLHRQLGQGVLRQQQRLLRPFALRDVGDVGRHTLIRREQAHLQPQTPGRVPVFGHRELPGFEGAPVGGLKSGAHRFGKHVPQHLAQHLAGRHTPRQQRHLVVDIHQALVGVGGHERVGDAAEHSLKPLVRGIAFARHPVAFHHILRQHQARRAAFKINLAGQYFHLQQTAVFGAVGPHAHVENFTRVGLFNASQQLSQGGHAVRRPDVLYRHAQKLGPFITIARHGSLVHRQKTQAGPVKHPHGVRVGLEKQPVPAFAAFQLTLSSHRGGDVAREAKQARDAVCTVQWAFGRQTNALTLPGVQHLLKGLRAVLRHHQAVVGLYGLHLLWRKQGAVVAPQHAVGRLPGPARGLAVEQQVAPFQIFGKNRLARTVGHGAEQRCCMGLTPQRGGFQGRGTLHLAVQAPQQHIQKRRGDAHKKPALPGLSPKMPAVVMKQQVHRPV